MCSCMMCSPTGHTDPCLNDKEVRKYVCTMVLLTDDDGHVSFAGADHGDFSHLCCKEALRALYSPGLLGRCRTGGAELQGIHGYRQLSGGVPAPQVRDAPEVRELRELAATVQGGRSSRARSIGY